MKMGYRVQDSSKGSASNESPELRFLGKKYDKEKMKTFIEDLKSRCHNMGKGPQTTPLERYKMQKQTLTSPTDPKQEKRTSFNCQKTLF